MARDNKSENNWLAEVIERIDKGADETRQGLAEVKKEMSEIAKIAERQQALLDEHIRRTEQNEKAIAKVGDRLAPLERHVSMWAGVGKILAAVGTILGALAALYEILGRA